MTIRKYIANNMSEGLRKVHDELGPDALILKTVRRNDKVELFVESELELDIEVDDNAVGPRPQEADQYIQAEYRQAKLRMLAALGDNISDEKNQPAFDEPQEFRLNTLDTDGEANVATFDSILLNATRFDKPEKTVDSLVQRMELDAQVIAQVRDCRRIDELTDSLARLLETDEQPARGINAFIGPAGSGKTTSLIKLMTNQVLQFGASSCGIVNCDRFRSGAREQLDRFGGLTDIEVVHISDSLSLNQAIARVAHRAFVAIDMPELNMADNQLKGELSHLLSSNYDVHRYLVLPANLQVSVMNRVFDAYQAQARISCILTRLDECDSLGPAFSFLVRRGLPLAYTTDGPHIPEDIQRARSVDFVQKMLFVTENGYPGTDRIDRSFAKGDISDLTNRKRLMEVTQKMAVDQ